MESEYRFNFGLVMIPLLIILNYVLVDRFQYILRHKTKEMEIQINSMKTKEKKKKKPVIEYNGKKYCFSTRALILFPVGTIILAVLLIQFFEMRANFWLHEVVTKQAVFVLNLFFNLEAETLYLPEFPYPWHINIPGSIAVYITSGCTGTPAMSILISIIIFTPHSIDPKTKEDIIWRKTVDIIATLMLIYFFNIIRMVIITYLYHLGIAWDVIHDSLANISAIVAAHIFIFWFCNKYIPEWYISIYYSGKLLYNKIEGSLILKKKIF